MHRLLLIKTSSLGDVIHALPALTDMQRCRPDLQVSWMVEESFAALPALHPGVHQVIPVATRRWRHHWLAAQTRNELAALRRRLIEARFDLSLDLQGLIKSALLGALVPTHHLGYNRASAREPLACWGYQETFGVPWSLHAVQRNRALSAQALGYEPDPAVCYGLHPPAWHADWMDSNSYVVLLHATSRADKEWPESHWISLGRCLHDLGLSVIIPAGSAPEQDRARRLAAAIPGAIAAPPLDLTQLAGLLGQAWAVVGVDTGLTHLAGALQRPVVALYTATDPRTTGVFGNPRALNCGGKGCCPTVAEVIQHLRALSSWVTGASPTAARLATITATGASAQEATMAPAVFDQAPSATQPSGTDL